MTTRQFLALQSAQATSAKFHRHHEVYADNEGLAEEVVTLDGMIDEVTDLAKQQAEVAKGLTVEQGRAREELVATLVEICGIGEGWAAKVKNDVLHAQLTVTATELTALGLKIGLVAPTLFEAARRAADLGAARYGLTEARLADLEGKIRQLVQAPTVRDRRDERKAVTEGLNTALVTLMTYLQDVIDPMVRAYERTEPRFYTEYRNSRRVGGRKSKESEASETSDASDASEEEAEGVAETPVAATDSGATRGQAVPAAAAQLSPAEEIRVKMAAQGLVVDQDAEADAALDHVLLSEEAKPAGAAPGVPLSS
jgi:hypothetical protein